MIAQWKTMKWEVTAQRIAPIEEFSTDFKRKKSEGEDIEGQAEAANIARELEQISFETSFHVRLGADIDAEIAKARSLIGEKDWFIIGGEKYGANMFALDSVGVSFTVDQNGKKQSAKLSYTFEEYSQQEAEAKTIASAEVEAEKAALGLAQNNQPQTSAVDITASDTDRVERK